MGRYDATDVHVNHTGQSLQNAIEAINHHEHEQRSKRKIALTTSQMTLLERHAALTFAVQYCEWADYAPPYVADIDEAGWRKLPNERPKLLPQQAD